MTHIIKRKGHKEKFDERKLYASVFAACMSAHASKEESEATANLVAREIKKWMGKKKAVDSNEIFEKATEELAHLNKDASFMYKTHRDIN